MEMNSFTFLFQSFFILIWLGLFIYAIVKMVNEAKNSKNAKEKIYDEVLNEKQSDIQDYINILTNNQELDKKRKSHKKINLYVCVIFVIIIVISLVLENWKFLVGAFWITFVFSLIWKACSSGSYSKIYKEQIIKTAIKNYNNEWQYNPNEGISSQTYKIGKFEGYSSYRSEDLITGMISGYRFSLSDVHTERESTDSDGNTSSYTVFFGPVAVIELNKLNNFSLIVTTNRLKLFDKNDYVELDNQLFEEKYDVFTSDKVAALRILTPSLMDKILELYNSFGYFYEFRLISGLLFFRFHSDSLFEPHPNNIEKEALSIAYYFKMLDGMTEIIEEIIKSLKEFER